jgi:hypothetical protein
MKQRFEHGLRWDAALEEIERREELAVALVGPPHAALSARAEQSGVEHFADIIIGRVENGEVALFAAASKD